jgi:hypothetical protein
VVVAGGEEEEVAAGGEEEVASDGGCGWARVREGRGRQVNWAGRPNYLFVVSLFFRKRIFKNKYI